jgi:hypothetical protein
MIVLRSLLSVAETPQSRATPAAGLPWRIGLSASGSAASRAAIPCADRPSTATAPILDQPDER